MFLLCLALNLSYIRGFQFYDGRMRTCVLLVFFIFTNNIWFLGKEKIRKFFLRKHYWSDAIMKLEYFFERRGVIKSKWHLSPGGVLDQKNDGDVRTENLNPPIHPYFFPDTHPYTDFRRLFSTFLWFFDSFFMIIRCFDSNYEILDDNWPFWDDFWFLLNL